MPLCGLKGCDGVATYGTKDQPRTAGKGKEKGVTRTGKACGEPNVGSLFIVNGSRSNFG